MPGFLANRHLLGDESRQLQRLQRSAQFIRCHLRIVVELARILSHAIRRGRPLQLDRCAKSPCAKANPKATIVQAAHHNQLQDPMLAHVLDERGKFGRHRFETRVVGVLLEGCQRCTLRARDNRFSARTRIANYAQRR